VLEGENPPTYVPPGTLLVVRRGGIVALHFDPVGAAVTGDDVPVAPTVGWDATMIRGALTASATGVLAYRATLAVPRQLVWFDRTGANRGAVGPPDEGALAGPEISHDGRRAAVYRTVGSNTDVWLVELGRGVSSRFTFHEQIDFFPLWSADDQRVIFGSNRNGTYEFFEKSADGAGDEMPIVLKTFTSTAKLPHSVSADGRFLLYGIQVPQTGVDLWALPLGGDRKAFAVVESKFDDMAGQFSPDGRWVAYQSNESERVEVYVTPFPGPGGHTQISFEGGTQARWRPDGRELFYVAADSRLMAVPVGASADRRSLEVGKPVPLFPTRLATGMNVFPAVGTKAQYAVAPDGRFLMNVPVEGATAPPITVMLNWDAALKK
jgi:Tol biopolymer transport system component